MTRTLLTDIQMPELSGIGLLRYVKKSGLHIHCMVLSGYDDFEYVKSAALLGIENYFLKPINLDEFSNTLANIVLKIQQEKEFEIKKASQNNLLLENFLSLWINNNMDTGVIYQKANIAHVDISGEAYCCAIIKLQNSEAILKNRMNTQHEMQQFASEIMRNNNLGLATSTGNSETTLIFIGSDNVLTVESLHKTTQAIATQLYEKYKIPVLICVGNIESSAVLLYRSFRKAKKLISHAFFAVKSYAVFFADEVNTPQNHYLSSEILQNIKLCTITKNRIGILSNLQDSIPNTKNHNTSKLMNTFFVAISLILYESESVGIETEAIISNHYQNMFSRCVIETKNDLVEVASQVLTELFEDNSIKDSDNYVKLLKDYVILHYGEALSLKQLADMMHISPSYLGQIFLSETNISFSNYLNDFRIQKAKNLLRNTDLKTTNISVMTGFTTVNYFTTTFRKLADCTPAEYRAESTACS